VAPFVLSRVVDADCRGVNDLLHRAAAVLGGGSEARREARWLLQHVTGWSHADVIARAASVVDPAHVQVFETLLARRAAGEPLAYLLGYAEFRGRRFAVGPAVLVPRPETEELVTLVLAQLAGTEAPRCLELGTGSGAIAISLALELPGAQLVATDLSSSALDVAKNNAQTLRASIDFRAGSWYAPLALGERFNLIVSNPPYIAAGDPHLQGDGLRFEPISALSDGGDGLACIREIIAGARAHLVCGGSLWFEHGYDQGPASRNLLQAAGFEAVLTHQDFAGHNRISGGRLFF